MTSKEKREVMIAALERMAYREPGDNRLLLALRQVNELEKDCGIYQDANIRLSKEFEQERATLTRKNRALKHEIRKLHRAREQDWEAGKRWRKEFIEHSERLWAERLTADKRIAELEAAAQRLDTLELDRAVQGEIARAFGELIQAIVIASPRGMWPHGDRVFRRASTTGLRTFARILHTAFGGRIPDEAP